MNIIRSSTLRDQPVNMERVREMVRARVTEEQRVERVAEYEASKEVHADAYKVDQRRNGWSGAKKNFRRIASVPASAMREFRQIADPNDHKAFKAFLREKGYHTVDRNSF